MWRSLCLLLLPLLAGSEEIGKGSEEIKIPCDSSSASKDVELNASKHAYINCQRPDDFLGDFEAVIYADAKDSDGLALDISSTRSLEFSVSGMEPNETSRFTVIFEGGQVEKRWLPTGQNKIKISFKGNKTSAISMKIRLSCETTFEDNQFVSPLLPNKPYSSSKIATCSFKYQKPAVITFDQFILANGSSANFTGLKTSDASFGGPFTDKKPDHVVIVGQNSQLNLNLNLSNPNQTVTYDHVLLSGDLCKDNLLIVDKATSIPLEVKEPSNPISCVWLLRAPEDKKLDVEIQESIINHGDEMLSVIDSGLTSGRTLLQLTALNNNTRRATSSGRYVLLSFDAKSFDQTEHVKISVTPVTSGGSMIGNGTMTIKDDAIYTLSTSSDTETLIVLFSSLMKLNDTQKIEVYADSNTEPLLVFDKTNAVFDVSSPGSKLVVKASGFKGSAITVTVTTVPRGSGCLRTFTAPREDALRLIGSCIGQCSWIIKPVVPGNETQMFLKVLPNNVPSGKITHFKDSHGEVILNNSADPFVMSYLVKDGAKIEFDCSHAKEFELSYVTKSVNDGLVVQPAQGANFSLTSPMYPGTYPQGAEFSYTVTVPDPKVNYLASIQLMELINDHRLQIGKTGFVITFNGSDLAGDKLIPGSAFEDVVFMATTLDRTNPKGGYGFRLSLTPASTSQTFTEPTKNFTTGDKCKEFRCIYVVELGMPNDKNTSVSMNLTIALPANTTLAAGELRVWDGESTLRSPLIASEDALLKGGTFTSRSNKVIIVYQGTPKLSLGYVTSKCSYEDNTMCLKDRLCHALRTECESAALCSDGSDKFNCDSGGHPKPKPSPAPATSSGWSTAFWICMPFFIVMGAALHRYVPLIIQKVRDSQYQQFHDLGDH